MRIFRHDAAPAASAPASGGLLRAAASQARVGRTNFPGNWPRAMPGSGCTLCCLTDSFKDVWHRNQFELKTYWAQIEASSPLRMVEAYRDPDRTSRARTDKVSLTRLVCSLMTPGIRGSASTASALVKHFRATGDLEGTLLASAIRR